MTNLVFLFHRGSYGWGMKEGLIPDKPSDYLIIALMFALVIFYFYKKKNKNV